MLSDQWRAALCSVFGKRKALKRWKQVSRDIIAVAYGIKAAYLFDRWSTTPELISTLLQLLYDEDLTPIKLDLVVVDTDLIIYSRDYFLAHSQRMNAKFVDVSASLQKAALIDSSKAKTTTESFSSFVDYVKDCKQLSKSELSYPSIKQNNAWYDVCVTESVNPTCLFGLFLGYPWIYWFDNSVSEETCLSMYSFRLYKVKARDVPRFWCNKYMPHKVDNNKCDDSSLRSSYSCLSVRDTVLKHGEVEDDFDHVLFSFTVPEEVLASDVSTNGLVADWFWEWRNSTKWNELFSHVWLENVSISMPSFAL